MVLRHDRHTGAVAQPMSAGGMVAGFTAGDVGRALRRARTRQGLSIKDVSTRTGLPVTQLRAAETGALDVPNQLSTLKAVRRYADFLGLPGDRFALALLEHWPTNAAPPRQSGPADATAEGHRRPGTLVTAPNGVPDAGPPSGRGTETGPPTATLPVLRQRGAGTGASITPLPAADWQTFDDGTASHATYAYHDTGVTPAVRAPDDRRGPRLRGRRRRNQLMLRALVWVVALAVLAGLAALVVDWVRPSAFGSVGTGSTTATTGASTATTVASGHRTGTAPASTTPRSTPASTTHKSPVKGAASAKPVATSPTTASMTVGSSPFVVQVAAVGGEAWVQVTSPTATAPLFAGVLDAGQSKSFTVSRSAAVEVGAAAGRMSVSAKSKALLSTYQPPGAPYTVTFQTSSG